MKYPRNWRILQRTGFFPCNKRKEDHSPQYRNSEIGVVQWKMLKIDCEPPEKSQEEKEKKRLTVCYYNVKGCIFTILKDNHLIFNDGKRWQGAIER